MTQDSAAAWLTKMSEALKTRNFQISFVVLKAGAEAQPYTWRHAVLEDGTEMEQLSLLNGPGKEVLRINDRVSYFEPNVPSYSLNSGVINGPIPGQLLNEPLSLTDSYEFILVGRSRISGRAAQQIRIVAKDKNRFGYNLWLDQDTGLLLKLNMLDMEGMLLEQVQVTSFQVTEAPHSYFTRVETGKLPQVITFDEQQAPVRWEIAYMPQGMKVIKRDTHRLPFTGSVVDYVMLSDGMVDVSVYLQHTPEQSNDNDLLWRIESNTFITRRQGPFSVTVIGKLPPQTANAIASSITPVNP